MIRNLAFVAASLMIIAGVALPAPAQDAAAPQYQQIEGIVAVVNDDPISFSDVRQRARMLLLSLGGRQPTQEQIQQITGQALEQLIDEKLQLQEASEYDVDVSQSDIDNAVRSLARQSGLTREDLLNSLLQAGINPASLEDQTRADIAWRRIMGGLYGSRIRISDNQISDQISRLKAASQEEQYLLSEIFLFAPTQAEQMQAMEAANSILEQLNAGAPFELAAQSFSSAPTAATGGDMGWLTLKDLDTARAAAISALPGPGLTPPIQVENGLYLMSVRNKREPAQASTFVDLTRISVANQSETDLKSALDAIESCDGIDAVVDPDDNLTAVSLDNLNVNDLGPEGKAMVLNTPTGTPTDIFAQSGTLVSMFVCERRDNMEALPNREQVEDRLYSQQLGMISERSLRNLRREATIIRRQ